MEKEIFGPWGILKYDLSCEYQKAEFEAAINASSLKNKVETLYDEVFRPCFKHDRSFLSEDSLDTLSDEEFKIAEAIWVKVNAHFKGE